MFNYNPLFLSSWPSWKRNSRKSILVSFVIRGSPHPANYRDINWFTAERSRTSVSSVWKALHREFTSTHTKNTHILKLWTIKLSAKKMLPSFPKSNLKNLWLLQSTKRDVGNDVNKIYWQYEGNIFPTNRIILLPFYLNSTLSWFWKIFYLWKLKPLPC